jgi:CubicO group peptidase (beta-lactamase class C family)
MKSKKEKQAVVEKIDKLVNRTISKKTPGCALAIIHQGKPILAKGFGLANLETDTPITATTSFYLASLAKQFTGMGIALLVEKGQLTLKENIRTYLPELPEYCEQVTVEHLLHQQSGLVDYIRLFFFMGLGDNQEMDCYTNAEVFNLILRQKKLRFVPGDTHEYSNTNYFLLAKIIERVANQSFNQFIQSLLFNPLKMHHSFFLESSSQLINQRAIGYKLQKESKYSINTTRSSISGGSGLISTLEDFIKWNANIVDNHLGKNRTKIIELLSSTKALNDGTEQHYGYGLIIDDYKGLKHIHHTGQFAALKSTYHHFPDQELSVILFSNLESFAITQRALEISDLFLSDYLEIDLGLTAVEKTIEESKKQALINLPREKLTTFCGIYRSLKSNLYVTFVEKDGKLLFYVPDKACIKAVYEPITEYRFKLTSRGTSEILPSPFIEFQKKSESTDLIFIYSEEIKSTYRKFLPNKLTSQSKQEYSGKYYCQALDCFFGIQLINNSFFLKLPNTKIVSLYFIDKDEFVRNFDWLVFQRDKQNKIKGFFIYDFNSRLQPANKQGIFCQKIEVK